MRQYAIGMRPRHPSVEKSFFKKFDFRICFYHNTGRHVIQHVEFCQFFLRLPFIRASAVLHNQPPRHICLGGPHLRVPYA